ncbi:BRCA1-A complex subunit RAP80 isoform X1 [Neophocaena asiaeorientalis asiaeorientalis]|uniref:BRCA1-A complex subunit RAP80 n=1 Tax=Neophocaena asiaeorientalis asiaeorientalis TaxID=1706337 RepID=A0A341B8B7_NEOAA|nr:BRCA1-A complex subunit RAP80 isoform X1 [Neophocaena asiaeorientalis asiaeorientalis]
MKTKQLNRAKCLAKRKIAQMTEEEQFALAVKMSEQEAREVNSQEEEEEELLRKAIAESLNSCRPSDASATRSRPLAAGPSSQSHQEKTTDSGTTEGMSPCSGSFSSSITISQGYHAESRYTEMSRIPLVVLKRLNQKVVEISLISSILLSPRKSQLLVKPKEEPFFYPLYVILDNLPSPLNKKWFVLSPTFSQIPTGIWQLVPPSLFKGSHISQGNESEEREEPWDRTENTEEEPVSGSSGSWDQSSQPVFENENVKCFDRCTGHLAERTQCGKPQESTGKGCAFHKAAQGRGDTSRHCLPTPADAKGLQDIGGTVHYFWGIPFCPAGVDPNQYTKVILCQLEVYQKSLKMAQRQLLKKKGFGEPVLPRPPSLIQNECGQGDQASEKNERISEDMGDEDKEERQESRASVWHSKTKDFQESPIKSLKEKLLLEEEPTTSHGQSSQGLFVEETSEEGNSVPAPQSIAALNSKRSSVLMPESSAEEITVCPETQLSSPETFDLEKEDFPGSRETVDEVRIMADKEVLQVDNREDAEKEIPTTTFSSSTQVSCPLCDQGFPPTKIERHAMYCNGLMGQDTVLTRRQKETKRKSKSESGTAAQISLDIDKKKASVKADSLVSWNSLSTRLQMQR